MSTNQLKGVIIVAVPFSIVCFVFMRAYSIPFEESWILDIIYFGFVAINIVVWEIFAASKKEDKQAK
jgi:hypothetical protein